MRLIRRDFGVSVEEQRTIGVLVIMLGVVALLPCCFGVYLLKQSITHRGRRRVLMPVELDGTEIPESVSSKGLARYEQKGGSGHAGHADAENQRSGKSGPSRLDEMRREAGAGRNTPFSKQNGSSKGSQGRADAVILPPKVLTCFLHLCKPALQSAAPLAQRLGSVVDRICGKLFAFLCRQC